MSLQTRVKACLDVAVYKIVVYKFSVQKPKMCKTMIQKKKKRFSRVSKPPTHKTKYGFDDIVVQKLQGLLH